MNQMIGSKWRADSNGWESGYGAMDELLDSGLAYAVEPDPVCEQNDFEVWRAAETERLERKQQKLRRQKFQIQQERQQLDMEKQNFKRQQEYEATRQRHEEQLLDKKRQILEEELYKLAEERRQFEQKKSFYDQVNSYQRSGSAGGNALTVGGELFFVGVNSAGALKKRYKDLLKIYHPDNKCGDTDTIQVINREYQRLLVKYAV